MLSGAQARVISPILTTFVRGYTNAKMVGRFLFPTVSVSAAGGQIIEFGKENFMLYATERSAGGNTSRIGFGYKGKEYACRNHALEAKVPDELRRDAQAVPAINLAQGAVQLTWDAMSLRLEWEQASAARNPANYGANNKLVLSGAQQWNQSTSNPEDDVEAAFSSIQNQTGQDPNVLILPPRGIKRLSKHQLIKDRFKYTSSKSITAEMLAEFFEVKMVVEGKARYADSAGGVLMPVWGNDAIMAYVPEVVTTNMVPSYGYTYTLEGHPYVKNPYYEASCESWIYGVKNERTPTIAGAAAGFLFQNIFA